ncbi:MAG: hypothetical protein A2977_01055 [Alphaproteobacteria bacterium RIFCSPLOWO2_01_FULL_45_8]|nr:MAG: hypothetical protein A2065_03430 [Alphaproteobacteria bacterium GWB1_45_5]OFW76755.1 MAG: hypothetical protein A3K20_01120 [Alphaproteobacteria bacterium GWA1_45_9]OFW89837.1 MAG: hypothetical protein A2621_03005 [Alphaproteobacteria bacterium RIFCSPHIGHO2_01_FULL_41_14]OFW96037.1 MAG: hypothetical protein A2977_01055 [Alphaproteobacteria bacterium RIFCSPLOWO2_01_FULL_45_8]HCI48970.1 hypothetical protein [Holosporales bacterium]
MIHHLKSEKDVHGYVRYLKNFYGELSVYILVITISLIVWLLMGGGYFWPLWIILIWGIVLLLKASRLHIINPFLYEGAHKFREKLPFIRPQWQEEKVQEILKKMGRTLSEMAGPMPGSTSSKSAAKKPAKKATRKKAPARKPAKKSSKKPSKAKKK